VLCKFGRCTATYFLDRKVLVAESCLSIQKTDRVHNCPCCGLLLDRDLNAARNILKRCTVGHTEINACGAILNGVALKQEALTLLGVGVCHEYAKSAVTPVKLLRLSTRKHLQRVL
jgi:hypothetical protein